MIVENEKQLTEFALSVMQRTPDPRLREIMTSLVSHLHSFVRDVRLTEREFQDACAIIAEMGHLTTDTHNEVVLMAGSLGVSSLVCLLNNGDMGNTETNQNLLGPFWRLHHPPTPNGASIMRSKTVGEPLFVRARFIDVKGAPIVGAEVDAWQSNADGFYENQDETQVDMNLRIALQIGQHERCHDLTRGRREGIDAQCARRHLLLRARLIGLRRGHSYGRFPGGLQGKKNPVAAKPRTMERFEDVAHVFNPPGPGLVGHGGGGTAIWSARFNQRFQNSKTNGRARWPSRFQMTCRKIYIRWLG